MEPLTAEQIRAGLVNATKGEATRLRLPSLDGIAWQNLDFFGWRDPSSGVGSGIAVWRGDEVVSMLLQATPKPAGAKQGMCSLCHTFHPASEVGFMGAKRAGARGRDGNTVAASICADLACSLYVRKLKHPTRVQPQETLDEQARIARLERNLWAFVARVADGR